MRVIPVAALLAALFVVGCSSRPSLVGEWKSTGVKPTSFTFRDDGTAVLGIDFRGQSIRANAKYTLNQNRLVITDIQPVLGGMEAIPGVGSMSSGMLANMDLGEVNLQISWKSNDEILLSGNVLAEGNFKRVKN